MVEGSISPELRSQLRNGSQLTSKEVEDVKSMCSEANGRKLVVEELSNNPEKFLESFSKCSTSDGAVIAQVLQGVEDASQLEHISEICRRQIAQEISAKTKEFYLNIYLKLSFRRPGDSATLVSTLAGLLATNGEIQKIALLTLMMHAKKSKDFGKHIVDYLSKILSGSPEEILRTDYLCLLRMLEAFFPIFPAEFNALYTSEQCKRAFLYRILLLDPEKYPEDVSVAEEILNVLSASSVNEQARKFNTANYLQFLISGTKVASSKIIVAHSLLCIVKLWNFSATEKHLSLESVVSKICELFKLDDCQATELQYLLECLAYLSLGDSTRKTLRGDDEMLDKLILLLDTSDEATTTYGVLLVFSNLSKCKDPATDKDTSTINYLKKFATPEGGLSQGGDDDEIYHFNSDLVTNYKLVGTISGLPLQKENVITQAVIIVYNLCLNQPNYVLSELASQGGLSLILDYFLQHSKTINTSKMTCAMSASEADIQTRLYALRSLAIMCRSVNPANAFSKYDPKISVPFLVELLGPSIDDMSSQFDGNERTNDPSVALFKNLGPLDTYYSLLALTNLTSLDSSDLHRSVIWRTFDLHLSSLMIDSTNVELHRECWALINNLIVEPTMAAKFFNTESKASMKNLDLMINLLHSKDEKLQVIIAGLLANVLLQFSMIAESIVQQQKSREQLLRIISAIFTTQSGNDDLILRVATTLLVLLEAALESGRGDTIKLQSDDEMKRGIKTVVTTTKSKDVMSLMRELIQLSNLKF